MTIFRFKESSILRVIAFPIALFWVFCVTACEPAETFANDLERSMAKAGAGKPTEGLQDYLNVNQANRGALIAQLREAGFHEHKSADGSVAYVYTKKLILGSERWASVDFANDHATAKVWMAWL